jgi:putative colanic acid biosynthesis acetyltransferase WcaF
MKSSTVDRRRKPRLVAMSQGGPYSSPWTWHQRIGFALWKIVWTVLCRPTPKYFIGWRNLVLKAFGAKLQGRPFVSQRAVIKIPWNLELHDRSCIGPQAEVYSLAPVILEAGCTIAQQAYLCCGTHNFDDPRLPLVVGPIVVRKNAFIGARAFICPGVEIGEGAVVGACAVVTRDVEPWTVVAGNPARLIRKRSLMHGDQSRLGTSQPSVVEAAGQEQGW